MNNTLKTNIFRILIITIPVIAIIGMKPYKPQDNNVNIAKLERKAKHYFNDKKYYKAKTLYAKLDSLRPETPDYMYKLAVCYLENNAPRQSINYFNKCLKNPDEYDHNIYLKAAKAFHQGSKFKTAKNLYNIYKAKLSNKNKNIDKIIAVNREIEKCKNGIRLSHDPLDAEFQCLSNKINSAYTDKNPQITNHEQTLIFTSGRPESTGNKQNAYNGNYYEDIYIAHKNNKQQWEAARPIDGPLNTEGHDAVIDLSGNGNTMILYRYTKEGFLAKKSGDLFISTKNKDNTWGEPQKLTKKINTEHHESSASLAENNKLLFFTSDKPGGKGGTDIYYTKKQNGTWASPESIGEPINSKYNEISPRLHPDGKRLFFASNGHNSMGGYDIFYAEYNDNTEKWSKPKNIGYPINSPTNEKHFSFSEEGRKIYLSSVRENCHRQEDIFSAYINKEKLYALEIEGTVTNSKTSEFIEDATVKIINKNANDFNEKLLPVNEDGSVNILLRKDRIYQIHVHAANYKDYSEQISTYNIESFKNIKKRFPLVPNTPH